MNIGSISSAFNVIQLLIPAIQTAEQFIRGRGRGAEKKEAVMSNLVDTLKNLISELKETGNMGKFSWVKLALNLPVFFDKVSKIVDAIVDLANFLQTLEEKEESKEVLN